jgi:hypothetical protein
VHRAFPDLLGSRRAAATSAQDQPEGTLTA